MSVDLISVAVYGRSTWCDDIVEPSIAVWRRKVGKKHIQGQSRQVLVVAGLATPDEATARQEDGTKEGWCVENKPDAGAVSEIFAREKD